MSHRYPPELVQQVVGAVLVGLEASNGAASSAPRPAAMGPSGSQERRPSLSGANVMDRRMSNFMEPIYPEPNSADHILHNALGKRFSIAGTAKALSSEEWESRIERKRSSGVTNLSTERRSTAASILSPHGGDPWAVPLAPAGTSTNPSPRRPSVMFKNPPEERGRADSALTTRHSRGYSHFSNYSHAPTEDMLDDMVQRSIEQEEELERLRAECEQLRERVRQDSIVSRSDERAAPVAGDGEGPKRGEGEDGDGVSGVLAGVAGDANGGEAEILSSTERADDEDSLFSANDRSPSRSPEPPIEPPARASPPTLASQDQELNPPPSHPQDSNGAGGNDRGVLSDGSVEPCRVYRLKEESNGNAQSGRGGGVEEGRERFVLENAATLRRVKELEGALAEAITEKSTLMAENARLMEVAGNREHELINKLQQRLEDNHQLARAVAEMESRCDALEQEKGEDRWTAIQRAVEERSEALQQAVLAIDRKVDRVLDHVRESRGRDPGYRSQSRSRPRRRAPEVVFSSDEEPCDEPVARSPEHRLARAYVRQSVDTPVAKDKHGMRIVEGLLARKKLQYTERRERSPSTKVDSLRKGSIGSGRPDRERPSAEPQRQGSAGAHGWMNGAEPAAPTSPEESVASNVSGTSSLMQALQRYGRHARARE